MAPRSGPSSRRRGRARAGRCRCRSRVAGRQAACPRAHRPGLSSRARPRSRSAPPCPPPHPAGDAAAGVRHPGLLAGGALHQDPPPLPPRRLRLGARRRPWGGAPAGAARRPPHRTLAAGSTPQASRRSRALGPPSNLARPPAPDPREPRQVGRRRAQLRGRGERAAGAGAAPRHAPREPPLSRPALPPAWPICPTSCAPRPRLPATQLLAPHPQASPSRSPTSRAACWSRPTSC